MKNTLFVSGALAAVAATACLTLKVISQLLKGPQQNQEKEHELDKLGKAVILKNRDGVEVHITPVGASIQRLIVPVGKEKRDVVLGFNKPSTYALLSNPPYFGAVVGRCANRIANGKFKLEGQEYTLATNNGPNALHGGPSGFHTRLFQVESQQDTEDSSAVVLSYTSADGEEGYPGTLHVTVRYELLASAPELKTTITATTDKPTSVNLAQHSYFNLAGHDSRSTILDHVVQLAADHYTPVDDVTQIPTGDILPVAGTPFDFTTEAHAVGERISQVPGGHGYDHNYVLFGMGPQARYIVRNQAVSSTPRLAATVVEPASGLKLEVLTTTPGMQFYTGGFLGCKLADAKDGAHYPQFAGLCLEAQNFPDAINQQSFPSVVLQPGDTYKQQLVYRFSVPYSSQHATKES